MPIFACRLSTVSHKKNGRMTIIKNSPTRRLTALWGYKTALLCSLNVRLCYLSDWMQYRHRTTGTRQALSSNQNFTGNYAVTRLYTDNIQALTEKRQRQRFFLSALRLAKMFFIDLSAVGCIYMYPCIAFTAVKQYAPLAALLQNRDGRIRIAYR